MVNRCEQIVGPMGNFLAGPDNDGEDILIADLDSDLIVKGKYYVDCTEHYVRSDIFQLHVDRRTKLGPQTT